MGYLKKIYGMALLGKTQDGTCPECAVKHDPEQPHNRDSLAYQYKFYDQHGRWPTWSDAMAHCPKGLDQLNCFNAGSGSTVGTAQEKRSGTS